MLSVPQMAAVSAKETCQCWKNSWLLCLFYRQMYFFSPFRQTGDQQSKQPVYHSELPKANYALNTLNSGMKIHIKKKKLKKNGLSGWM